MKITIPLSVQSARGLFTIRPLFFGGPSVQAQKLERALHKLTRELRETLHFLGKNLRHDAIARYTFHPDFDAHRVEVPIELRRRNVKCRFLFVIFEAFERRIAFTPSLPALWFDVLRGRTLESRAAEVLSEYFRKREREDQEDFVPPEQYALDGSAWIHSHEMDIYPSPRLPEADDMLRMFLGPRQNVDGEYELFRVGRCLDYLYPDDLDRVLLRDAEIDELSRLLQSSDRRPVLLLGPSLVGKTALLHEHVYRSWLMRRDKHKVRNLTFLLAPQRLISGMSYVGQWENRLLAILKEARKKNHLLFFDDFLGLYHAGVTSQSDLNVAHVLKPYVERRDVRLIAEMTPEAFRVLRERDRGFADLFHVLPVRESEEAETLRILIETQRTLEGRERCKFAIDVLPTVIDLQRRYARTLAFPGKACQFMGRVAVKHHDKDITRKMVLHEFHLQSGLSLTFLDGQARLERDKIVEPLAERIIGQHAALDAAADVIAIAKARLNDPERPLGTFLFLGPTGVGKTQCAKAIATFLFGAADQLLRFDMNEFIEPGAAARLVGTFYQPEGLLTSAVRRRPFAVILLDEIEKAHPEVFDLLLQVLGEGRLTDAHGRLADFTNTIIILTSNLGVRESQNNFGFRGDDLVDPTIFVRAAERFFRPEFFNRLDRIVPFGRLSRQDTWKIAQGLIHDVLQREGLVRRKCLLEIEGGALERIVDKGFDPKFGARALKRSIERHVTHAVAARLAEGLPDTFTHIHVYPAGRDIAVHVQGLEQVAPNPPTPALDDTEAVLDKMKMFADRIANEFAHLRPKGAISGDTREHYAYFAIQEAVAKLRRQIRLIHNVWEDQRQSSRRYMQQAAQFRRTQSKKLRHLDHTPYARILHSMAAAQDVQLYLKELGELASVNPSDYFDEEDDRRRPEQAWTTDQLLLHARFVQTLADCINQGVAEQTVVYLRGSNVHDAPWLKELARYMSSLFNASLNLEWAPIGENNPANLEWKFVVKGLAAWPIASLEAGTHLCCPNRGGVTPIQVMVWPVPADATPESVLAVHLQERRDWQQHLEKQEAKVGDDPFRLQPVVRIHQENGKKVDLRSGEVYPYAHVAWLIEPLPLPVEFQEFQE
ncbi:MAG TPA: AAA family ATPase [Gemmataceae bacterium]|nr:AAA family ATPase [Gemmataceae bacterium]